MECPAASEGNAGFKCRVSLVLVEHSAAIAFTILIAVKLQKQTEKFQLGPGACGPVLGGGFLSGRASSPVLEGALWAGSPLVGGVS